MMSRPVSANIFWLTASRVVSLALLFFAYAQLFRYLGPETYGRYQFVLSYVMIFSTLVDFGVQQFIIKKISEDASQAKRYFQSFFAFEATAAFLLYGALLAVAWASGYDRTVLAGVAVAGLGMVANALCYPFLAVMSSFQDLRRVAFINFLNSLVNVSVIALVIWFGRGIVFLAGTQLAFGLLDLVLYRAFIRRHLERPEPLGALRLLDVSLITGILRSAWPFVLLVGFSSIYNRIDVVLISRILGYEQTGYYGAAYKLYDLLAFFPAVVSHSLFPHFTRLMAEKATAEVRLNLERYLRLMVTVAAPIAFGGAVLSGPLISLAAGDQYAAAAPILRVLIWAPAILFVYTPVNSLVISQLTRQAAMVTGANVLVNVLGNLILLPRFGPVAAATMTVVSEAIQATFYFWFVRRYVTNFGFVQHAYRPILCAAAMALVLAQLPALPLLALLAVGALVYGLLLLMCRAVSYRDLRGWAGLLKGSGA